VKGSALHRITSKIPQRKADPYLSPIKSITPVMEGMTVMKLGIFDNVPAPTMEIYAKDRQEFLTALPGCAEFQAMPG
jgi:hypothetical protein